MDLDDLDRFKQLDTLNMLGEIDNLPKQLANAYELGMRLDLPAWKDIKQVVIAGMGGSAIGADLLASYSSSLSRVPVAVHRDYGLPLFAAGQDTLVICSSHSGNTEETLNAFDAAIKAQCRIAVVCTGGELARRAEANNIPYWTFEHAGQPRAAVGFSFGLLLAMFQRLVLIPDQTSEMEDTLNAMNRIQKHLRADVITTKNPAKRYAGQLMGRWVTVMGAGLLTTVARRWKGQLNEVAKAGANFEFLPEADHNTLAGTMNPQETLNAHTMT
ncbi:MAG TPA: SIS domain-containing protein, partial [Anaerolineales bacterium]|nr:SIS domain-containing protein [Anaerolineales bacterium]